MRVKVSRFVRCSAAVRRLCEASITDPLLLSKVEETFIDWILLWGWHILSYSYSSSTVTVAFFFSYRWDSRQHLNHLVASWGSGPIKMGRKIKLRGHEMINRTGNNSKHTLRYTDYVYLSFFFFYKHWCFLSFFLQATIWEGKIT